MPSKSSTKKIKIKKATIKRKPRVKRRTYIPLNTESAVAVSLKNYRKLGDLNVKRCKKTKKAQRGGFWPFTSWGTDQKKTDDASTNKKGLKSEKLDLVTCPNPKGACNTLDTQFDHKINPTWETCITANSIKKHIIYITPNNVIIKSVETIQIPEFLVKLDVGPIISAKIKIEDKFVECFMFICGQWYVSLRLFTTVIYNGPLAFTAANRTFFRLSNKISFDVDISNPSIGSSLITFPKDSYTVSSEQYTLQTSATDTITLSPEFFENISPENDPMAYNTIVNFRNQKTIANEVKQEIVLDVVEEGAETIFNFAKDQAS
uniref:Uncharacterized protein n=1 Tax=viral metagenome TaxID=1070528 RepID=A0A6C0JHF1_9ZZZZ